MALPKVTAPTYELELPSSGKKIKYRPFLVKEEKILLIALDSKDEKQITQALIDVLNACVISRVKIEDLPSFDLEYVFLKVRAASVGEEITLNVTCTDDNKTKVSHTININDVFEIGDNNPPVIDDQTFNIDENSSEGTWIGAVVASDPDGDNLTYTLSGGTGQGTFAIDNLGNLSVSNNA